jgi:drug/metabolite transporter (DMT)-like permease
LRQAMGSLPVTAVLGLPAEPRAIVQPLYEATLGAAVTSGVLALVLPGFRIGPLWPALGWLAVLAVTSQVVGWLLITASLPRLPAGILSAVLLVQPVGAVALGVAVLGQYPSLTQLSGVALVLAGVLVVSSGRRDRPLVPISHSVREPDVEAAGLAVAAAAAVVLPRTA